MHEHETCTQLTRVHGFTAAICSLLQTLHDASWQALLDSLHGQRHTPAARFPDARAWHITAYMQAGILLQKHTQHVQARPRVVLGYSHAWKRMCLSHRNNVAVL